MKIAIVSQTEILEELRTTFGEDPLIRDALLRCDPDAQVDIVDWRDDSIDWHSYDGIFVSSTWNNTLHPKEFITWLDHCESDGTKRVINDKSWLLLNFVKGQYLQRFQADPDLAKSLIPTAIIKKPLSPAALSTRLTALDPAATQFVCKPEVAIGGDDTHIVNRHDDAAAIGQQISSIFKKYPLGGVMLQPFIDSITTTGEYQLLYINGTFSHAIVKPPGFKNYDRGNFTLLDASMLPDTMQEVAERFVKATSVNDQPLVRLRLDFVLAQDGKPLLLEAEGIEPRNNLLCLPTGKTREAVTSKLADAIAKRTLTHQHQAHFHPWSTTTRATTPTVAALATYAALRKAPPSIRTATSLFAGITSACALSLGPALYKPSPQSDPKP